MGIHKVFVLQQAIANTSPAPNTLKDGMIPALIAPMCTTENKTDVIIMADSALKLVSID